MSTRLNVTDLDRQIKWVTGHGIEEDIETAAGNGPARSFGIVVFPSGIMKWRVRNRSIGRKRDFAIDKKEQALKHYRNMETR